MMDRRVLVVDDEEGIRSVFEEVFSLEGYTVLTAESGEEALKILEKEDVHVIFVDLRLTGMDGTEFCRRMRKDRPIDCVYAMTGHASVFDLASCREAGFDDYFVKPMDFKILKKAAADAFERMERWRKR